jgi:hypothetical protein
VLLKRSKEMIHFFFFLAVFFLFDFLVAWGFDLAFLAPLLFSPKADAQLDEYFLVDPLRRMVI